MHGDGEEKPCFLCGFVPDKERITHLNNNGTPSHQAQNIRVFYQPAEINIQVSVGVGQMNGFPDRFTVPPVET